MSKYEVEFKAQKDDLLALLAVITNPLHQKILKNYRRHSLMEISGRSEQLLAPEMTVEHPVYKFVEGGKTMVFDGMDAVKKFYEALRKTDSLVMWTSNAKLAVSDWGFAGEVQFNQFVKGSFLQQESVFSGISDAGDGALDKKGGGEYEPDMTTAELARIGSQEERSLCEGCHATSSLKVVNYTPSRSCPSVWLNTASISMGTRTGGRVPVPASRQIVETCPGRLPKLAAGTDRAPSFFGRHFESTVLQRGVLAGLLWQMRTIVGA